MVVSFLFLEYNPKIITEEEGSFAFDSWAHGWNHIPGAVLCLACVSQQPFGDPVRWLYYRSYRSPSLLVVPLHRETEFVHPFSCEWTLELSLVWGYFE